MIKSPEVIIFFMIFYLKHVAVSLGVSRLNWK